MESKRQTESVLARLMGLEKPPPSKLVVHGRRRVHSESYLQDIALISQHQKWSFDKFSMDIDDRMLSDSSEDLQSSSSSEESLQRYRTENEMFQKLWLLNSSQNSEKGYSSLGGSFSPKKMISVSQTPIRNVLQNQKMLQKTNSGKRERDCRSGGEALRHGSMATNGIAKQVADMLKHSVWHDYLKGSQNQDVLDTKLTELNSLQGKMNTMDSKVGDEQCISNSMSSPSSGSSIYKNKKFNALMDWDSSEENLIMGNSSSIASSLHSEKDVSCEETSFIPTDFSEFVGKDLFEENPSDCVSPKEIFTCSDVESLSSVYNECVNTDATSQQVVADAFMPLHQQDNGSQACRMEANKPTYNAASNIKDKSSAAHPSAFHGSEAKLQHYPRAKRHKRIDIKDAKEGGEEINTKIEETRALSYLIDVLAESDTCYKLGQPFENPLDPFVFDSLEKKYSKQPSWLKSDRRLLFDRINCALSDILHPSTGINSWRTYKTSKLLFHCNQDVIREELLSTLVNQEKEAKRVPSDKVVGLDCNWLNLEEDIMIVVKDLEESLINELVEEIVSTDLLI